VEGKRERGGGRGETKESEVGGGGRNDDPHSLAELGTLRLKGPAEI